MKKRVLVINPNSSEAVTRAVAGSVARFGAATACSFNYVELPEAPSGIETHADVEAVIPLLQKKIESTDHDAYVLACFSDPGISVIRRTTGKRIFGIGECAYLQAMSLGKKFGIISILPASTERQLKYLRELGFLERMAASIPLNLGVSELALAETTGNRLRAVGEELLERGADVIILGCAGMAEYQQVLLEHFRVPVIDPSLAAAACVTSSFYVM